MMGAGGRELEQRFINESVLLENYRRNKDRVIQTTQTHVQIGAKL